MDDFRHIELFSLPKQERDNPKRQKSGIGN